MAHSNATDEEEWYLMLIPHGSCSRAIKITLCYSYTGQRSVWRAHRTTFSSCNDCWDCIMVMQLFGCSVPQIPIPSVPTYQPTTPIPQRLEAIQKYIRDLQYPLTKSVQLAGLKAAVVCHVQVE